MTTLCISTTDSWNMYETFEYKTLCGKTKYYNKKSTYEEYFLITVALSKVQDDTWPQHTICKDCYYSAEFQMLLLKSTKLGD